jgi:stage III sporulation protein AD
VGGANAGEPVQYGTGCVQIILGKYRRSTGMGIVQIVGMGLMVTLLILILKKDRPEIALQLSLALTIIIFLFMLEKISAILSLFENMAEKAHISYLYLNTILKIIGIAYITEFGSQLCKDAGEGAVANKIEFAGKVFIMVMAIPIIALVLDTIVKLIP